MVNIVDRHAAREVGEREPLIERQDGSLLKHAFIEGRVELERALRGRCHGYFSVSAKVEGNVGALLP